MFLLNKRFVSLSLVMCILFSGIAGRLGYIIFSGRYAVSSSYNSYTITVDRIFPTIYDRNLQRLTNKTSGLAAVIRPNEKCFSELGLVFDREERISVVEELKQGYPVVRSIDKYPDCKYIKIFETKIRHNSDQLAKHLVTSCESLYPNAVGSRSVNFAVDAIGRLLEGDDGTVIENNYNTEYGCALTIDSDIQRCVERAAKDMKSGAVVVLDIKSSEALAVFSTPNDYFNRALSEYTVGSVFKLIISACALENGINPFYICTGEITVGDTTFSCQNKKIHGLQTMKNALANSCNCYFINLALMLGAEEIYKTAQSFGFGAEIRLADEWTLSNGNFPDLDSLQSKGELALIGFGQGSLTTTPLHFASIVAAIANGGNYTSPSLLFGEIDDYGFLTEFERNTSARIISEETAEKLREYMRYVVTNGTGALAEYNANSAGKTSTAQSGRYIDGREVLNTWFAGFYPYDDPKYAIVVTTEDGVSGSADCCPIFRTIVEKLDK